MSPDPAAQTVEQRLAERLRRTGLSVGPNLSALLERRERLAASETQARRAA
jgi:hypothetical protein